jgi:hypothetical protein
MGALPIPAWLFALVLAAMAPFAVRAFATEVDRRARVRTKKALGSRPSSDEAL